MILQKVKNKMHNTYWLFFIFTGFVFFSQNISTAIQNEKYDKIITIEGTIINTILIKPSEDATFLILVLDNGKKYRLDPKHGLGFSKNFDVKLTIPAYSNPEVYDDVSVFHPDAISVITIEITAIPIPNSKEKIKYLHTMPPKTIKTGTEKRNGKGDGSIK